MIRLLGQNAGLLSNALEVGNRLLVDDRWPAAPCLDPDVSSGSIDGHASNAPAIANSTGARPLTPFRGQIRHLIVCSPAGAPLEMLRPRIFSLRRSIQNETSGQVTLHPRGRAMRTIRFPRKGGTASITFNAP
jgi:hypothetical protein